MNLSAQRHGRLLVVSVSGRVDHNTANAFRDGIAPYLADCVTGRDLLVLDLAAMDYISSAGLRAFMIMSREVKAKKGRLVLAAMQPLVQEIFDISKFTLLFEVFDTAEAACASLASAIADAPAAAGE